MLFTPNTRDLAAHEPAIVTQINEIHADAIEFYGQRLSGRPDTGWRMTGIDPEGADLRCAGDTTRLDFPSPVLSPEAARAALARFVAEVRR